MHWAVRRAGITAGVATMTGAGLYLLGLTPSSDGSGTAIVPFSAIVVIVGLCALLNPPKVIADPGATLRLSFIGEFTTLVFLGPVAMSVVAAIGALARTVSGRKRANRLRAGVLDVVTVVAASQAAGIALVAFGGVSRPLVWPWDAAPLAAGVVAYCFITCAVADVIAPLATGVATGRRWPREGLRGFPGHIIGATTSLALIELVEHEVWTVLPLVALPLYFAWDAYRAHVERGNRDVRRFDASRSRDHGVAVVDDRGVVQVWNDALASLLDCPAHRAMGRPLVTVVPGVAQTQVPAALRDTLTMRVVRTVAHVPVPLATVHRVLSVSIVPESTGALLLWRDVTEQSNAERTLRRTADRFALVADGANDGIWELDESNRTLFISSRWRSIVGLAPGDVHVARDEWFKRIHPEDMPSLTAALDDLAHGRVDHVECEHRLLHEDGSYRRVLCRCVAARDARGRTHRIAGSLTDVTETATARVQVAHVESQDALTGLLNRSAFVARVAQQLSSFKDRRTARFAVLYLDLDRFKVVNNSLGHVIGDELLIAVSRRLEACLRPGDVIARLGGDEFAILLQRLGDEMQANVVAFRLQEALQAPFAVGDRDVVISVSIGIAFGRVEYAHGEEIMRDADTAMLQAKSHGKARHELFDVDAHARAVDRLGLETDLRRAVKDSDFEVHYQPIVSLATRMCTGFESLVRWNRNGQPVSPADFIPMAEELGIIEPLGTWVMQQACRTFVEWQHRYPECELDCITVNVSARQLVQQGFAYLVEQTVEQNGMDPADLRIEITETALMDAPQAAAKVLAELREFGVKIYLDDFGTGYSSLSHLHKLPVDALKIDRSFVRGLLVDDRPAIVESILALARTLHTSVVAEGVEEERQAYELERLGCRHAQGFYFSRPIPATAIEQILTARQPLGGKRMAAPPPARTHLKPVRTREIA